MLHMRRMLSLLVGMIGTALLITSASASPIDRNVVFMIYKGALGGTIHISANGGQSFPYVYAGPYEFEVHAAVQSGTGIASGALVDRLIAMYCDSASYNLLMSYPYVQLTGGDVLNGYGRLYDHATPATAQSTYLHMSWALQYAFAQNTQDWYKAAQIYTWELMSDAVYGDPFDLANGIFQVASTDRTVTLLNEVNYIRNNATSDVVADVNVPVTLLQGDSDALYSDVISGATRYFGTSELSQEFLVDPMTPVPESATLSLLVAGLATLGGIARAYRKR